MTVISNQRLSVACEELHQVMMHIEQTNKMLETLEDSRKRLERSVLPELFHEAGIRQLVLRDGSVVTLTTLAEGSLPKDPAQRAEAIEWLVANGYEELIECKVVSSWARGDRTVAEAEARRLAALGNAKVAFEEGIHPRTLGARMRDRVVEGRPTPLTLLGITVFPRARFTKTTNGEQT
jgi:hypothetical protein